MKTILTASELDILSKLNARGVTLDMEKIQTECEIVEKKERESHIDFCKDSDIKESFKSARESVKQLNKLKS